MFGIVAGAACLEVPVLIRKLLFAASSFLTKESPCQCYLPVSVKGIWLFGVKSRIVVADDLIQADRIKILQNLNLYNRGGGKISIPGN